MNTVLSQISQSGFYLLDDPTCRRDSQNDSRETAKVRSGLYGATPEKSLRPRMTSEDLLRTTLGTVPKEKRRR